MRRSGYRPGEDAGPAAEGAKTAETLAQLASLLRPPRIIWLMLPAGKITEGAITQLGHHLSAGDIIIDGGNSFYKDDIRRAQTLCRTWHSLSRCRHERRHLGAGARVLPDGRRGEADFRTGGAHPQELLRRAARTACRVPSRIIYCGAAGRAISSKWYTMGLSTG